MAKATTYLAYYNGVLLGERISHRVYTHAVIRRPNRKAYWDDAYNYDPTQLDHENFDYFGTIADGTRKPMVGWDYSPAEIDHAKQQIEGGFDAYVERLRKAKIENYQNMKFGPYVAGFSQSLANAKRMALKGDAYVRHSDLVAIVEVQTKS